MWYMQAMMAKWVVHSWLILLFTCCLKWQCWIFEFIVMIFGECTFLSSFVWVLWVFCLLLPLNNSLPPCKMSQKFLFQDPEAVTIWVLFHAPKKQISGSGIVIWFSFQLKQIWLLTYTCVRIAGQTANLKPCLVCVH